MFRVSLACQTMTVSSSMRLSKVFFFDVAFFVVVVYFVVVALEKRLLLLRDLVVIFMIVRLHSTTMIYSYFFSLADALCFW